MQKETTAQTLRLVGWGQADISEAARPQRLPVSKRMSGLQSKRNINKSQNLLLRRANNMLFDSVLLGTLILEWHFWSLPQVTNRGTAVTGTSFVFCLQMLLLGFADHHFKKDFLVLSRMKTALMRKATAFQILWKLKLRCDVECVLVAKLEKQRYTGFVLLLCH